LEEREEGEDKRLDDEKKGQYSPRLVTDTRFPHDIFVHQFPLKA
jgi:hypothetical protein